MGDELVLRGLATAHLLQVSGTIAQRGASWLQRARTGGLVRLDLTPTRAAGAAPLRPFAIDARVCVHGDPNPVVEIGDSFSDLPRFTHRLDQAELKCVRALLSEAGLTNSTLVPRRLRATKWSGS